MRDCVSGVNEGVSSNFRVVEWYDTLAYLLVFLVALSRYQNNVASLGFVNSQVDSLAAVRLKRIANPAALQSRKGVIHDGNRIFAAWVVARQDDEIAAVARGFPHKGTLRAVAIATTTEHCDHPARTSALIQE